MNKPDTEFVAYSSRTLALHTDMSYYERPHGVQLFYCHRYHNIFMHAHAFLYFLL